MLGIFAAHIVGKCDDKVFEDREVSFLMREGNDFLSLNVTCCQTVFVGMTYNHVYGYTTAVAFLLW